MIKYLCDICNCEMEEKVYAKSLVILSLKLQMLENDLMLDIEDKKDNLMLCQNCKQGLRTYIIELKDKIKQDIT